MNIYLICQFVSCVNLNKAKSKLNIIYRKICSYVIKIAMLPSICLFFKPPPPPKSNPGSTIDHSF